MWRGEVVGKVIGKDVLNGIAQMAETCMVGYSREGLESTGVFLYESVMQWGIFLWVCVLIGSTKGLIWPCGMRGRIWVLVIRCVVDCIFLGTIRSVLDRQIQGLIRSVLGCQIKGLKRGVLENLFCALKIDVLSRVKRCVSTSMWRRIKRCVFGLQIIFLKRCVLGAKYWVTLECWLVTDSTLRAQFGIEERNLEGWFERVVSSMADEVAKLMSNLNFSEEEMIEMEPMEGIGQEQQSETARWVVAKLFTMRKVDGAAVVRVFYSVWKEQPLEEALDLGSNFFLFKFGKMEDKEFVLGRSPWTFDGELLALQPFDGKLNPAEYIFNKLAIWIRVYDLPLGYMNHQMGERISNSFGTSVAVDLRTGEGSMGSFLRFRSIIDCEKPLKRCVMLGKMQDGSPRMYAEGPYKFGEWLRVPLIRKRNGFQGVKRQGIVYTNKEMGGVVRGKQPEGSMQAGPRGGGRGQQGNVAQIRLRGPKRGLHGKYEVCTPVGSKKARSAPSSLVAEDDGNLEVKFSCEYGDNGPNPIKCNEFMLEGGEEWDPRKVRQVFNEVDAKVILECPINPINEDLQYTGTLGEALAGDCVKINVYRASNPTTRKAAVGVIARNSHGMMINGYAFQLRGFHTAESTEACTFKEGVRMAIENEWTHVDFEGDSVAVVSKLNRRELDRSYTAAHLRSTISRLVDDPSFSFSFVRRALNRAAHGLAQWAINEDVHFHFDYEIPFCIEHFVIEDAIFG
ncbi:hypothetical protein V6N12_013788 [Hibiscus sabdariffa]|uniref:DUF4283 domain-containing protein n=1 Tax=Hibiscus sabdariffa TaxID=183260 RepID=A0ABR2CV89_9ROSI